ncbi:MAG: hypothetical protein B7Z37_20285 [Verrucomicrobia bacterium 12-59-8]|nr:MAG: hypothetical protein B7Z37_20285 [Verrucomicrobia bacterium 12-59-8]
MAFQSDAASADFLRTTARSLVLEESAPAVNFLLEERLPPLREQAFLTASPGPVPTAWDVTLWWENFGNHFSSKVACSSRKRREVSTFAVENEDNHLAKLESNQDVVRLESVRSMYQLYAGDFDSVADLAAELRALIQSREPGKEDTFTDDQRSRLSLWLDGLNKQRDARPAFAAPYGEIEPLLAAPDWATQMRNVLGLAHLGGSPAKPQPVVLCRYSLKRVESEARRAKLAAWAAIPTVLEAGGQGGPGTAFFPFPKAAAGLVPLGFGATVNLNASGVPDCKAELLHCRIDYVLDDFVETSQITDEVPEALLSAARRQHFDLLELDLQYRSDVPPDP